MPEFVQGGKADGESVMLTRACHRVLLISDGRNFSFSLPAPQTLFSLMEVLSMSNLMSHVHNLGAYRRLSISDPTLGYLREEVLLERRERDHVELSN